MGHSLRQGYNATVLAYGQTGRLVGWLAFEQSVWEDSNHHNDLDGQNLATGTS